MNPADKKYSRQSKDSAEFLFILFVCLFNFEMFVFICINKEVLEEKKGWNGHTCQK